MLDEAGMGGEIVILAVLEDEDAAFPEDAFFEDEVGNLGQFLQGVGRVGKDEVELLAAGLDETEHVATQREGLGVGIQFLQAVADEAVVVAVLLDADHLAAAAGEEFERDAARAGEEVEGGGSVEVDVAGEHVEDVLLGKVGGWPRLERARNLKVASLVFPSYNPHSSLITHHLSLITHHLSLLSSSSLDEERLQVVGHSLDLRHGMVVEVGGGVDHVDLLQIGLQFLQQLFLIGNLAYQMQLVVLGIQLHLVPDVEQIVGGILGACGIEGVAEPEAVLLETEHLEAILVEIAVEFLAGAGETALVQMAPDGRDGRDEAHVLEMVIDDEPQVSVHGEDGHGIQVGQHVVEHGLLLLEG